MSTIVPTGHSPAARSGQSTFRPRARLLRILGEELISDEVVAVAELVKNAYDADASRVLIRFENVTSPKGRILVQDDGDGMSLDILLHRWMEPASSDKGRGKVRRTRRGRRFLGEKGVGRFAVDKLASMLELTTRTRGQKDELCVNFCWDDFADDARLLSDVKSSWELRKPIGKLLHGTTLSMTGLRTVWTERAFRRLCTRLARLITPHERSASFRIDIESDEFPDYAGELQTGYIDRAPYHIDAIFDGNRSIAIKVKGSRATIHEWNGHEELTTGPVTVRLHSFDLETDALARLGPRNDVRAWLRQWSGISIYRDSFRIWPYGEPHDDWLRLDQRRVNNPVVRLSNNQVVGSVHISADSNPELRDQTNREGLINNRAFEDLRRLCYFALQILEAERQSVRHPRGEESPRSKRKPKAGSTPIADEIEQLALESSGKLAGRLRALAKKAREGAARETEGSRRVTDGLVELAAAGQATGLLHETLRRLLESLRAHAGSLHARKSGEHQRPAIAAIRSSIELLDRRLALLEPSTEAVTNRRHAMDVAAELQSYRELILPTLEAFDTRMDVVVPEKGLLRVNMRPQTFHRLLHVLTSNSLDWLSKEKTRRIRVHLRPESDGCRIRFSDSGPGIPAEAAMRIFEPLFSLKEGGKGMGLAIAHILVEQHGGRIWLDRAGRGGGAAFCLDLPTRRPRSQNAQSRYSTRPGQ